MGLFITAMVLALIFIPNMVSMGSIRPWRGITPIPSVSNVANALKLELASDPSVLFWYIYCF